MVSPLWPASRLPRRAEEADFSVWTLLTRGSDDAQDLGVGGTHSLPAPGTAGISEGGLGSEWRRMAGEAPASTR